MTKTAAETTRLLCASAFTGGATFRGTVFKHLQDKHQAHAPEMGVDVPLLAAVCRAADRREVRYAFGASVLAMVGVMVVAGVLILNQGLTVAQFLVIGLLVFLSGLLLFAKVYEERRTLIRPFLRRNFDLQKLKEQYKAAPSDRQMFAGQEDQNLIVYKGFLPFVGAGKDFGGWSFAISTIKGSDDGDGSAADPTPFTTEELYREIERGLSSLEIDGTSVKDFFFVSGADIRHDREILPEEYGRPVRSLAPATAAAYQEQCDARVRHYRWIRIEDWGGEIEMSTFLRCAMRGSSLFVELKRFVLTPLARKYKDVDKIGSPSFGKVVRWFAMSMLFGPFYGLFAPFFLLGRMLQAMATKTGSADRTVRDQIREDPLYNYGAEQTLRTSFSSGEYHHYFQKLDTDFYSKVLEQEILDCLVRFLEEHHIDTSEIRESKKTILNSGIIVHGGDVKAESLAVGEGAKAVKNTLAGRLKTRGAEA